MGEKGLVRNKFLRLLHLKLRVSHAKYGPKRLGPRSEVGGVINLIYFDLD